MKTVIGMFSGNKSEIIGNMRMKEKRTPRFALIKKSEVAQLLVFPV